MMPFQTCLPPCRRPFRILLALYCLLGAAVAHAFDFQDVAKRAKRLAASAYEKPVANLPPPLRGIDYKHYQEIRFRPEKAHWRNAGLPFELEFFHPGGIYEVPVRISEVSAQGVREIPYDPTLFEFGSNRVTPESLHGLGFAGFRVRYPINDAKRRDEVLAFLGASYFRAVGKGQRYGLSARGLAIDTAQPGGEEFPRFVAFWIQRPGPAAKELTIYGLLDSPRAAGAYRFILRPGSDTEMEVSARLYLRAGVGKLGLAPLTSMYLFGDNRTPNEGDYRRAVHDSEGLSIHVGNDDWIWRPLTNPKRLLVTAFSFNNPVGFGLMQRRREFADFEDLADRYELRPSAWVEPVGAWGPGRVELVQIPMPDETNDNIVAYWVPAQPPKPGEAFDFTYRVLWQKERQVTPPTAWVARSMRGVGYTRAPDGSIGFAIDFVGPALDALAPDVRPEDVVSLDGNAQLVEHQLQRNEAVGGWRLVLRVRRLDAGKPVEMRAQLRKGNDVLSETWSYILPPD